MRRLLWLLMVGLLAAPVAARAARPAPPRDLIVFAASSLTEFMTEAKAAFEKTHPGVTVRSSTAASSELRIQIEQGAPADVFLSADTTNMNPLKQARLVEKPAIFTHNRLVIAVARRAKATIKTPADLAKPGLTLSFAPPEVPIGKYSRQVLKKLDAKYGRGFSGKVVANIKSEEPNVKASLIRVMMGEADAALVYATDITPKAAASVTAVAIPAESNVVADYPLAVVAKSRNKAAARDFVAFVQSAEGKALLRKHGFLP